MKKGFTLIELLVVIAIIGILSGIVLTSLNTARNKANDAAVKGDLEGIRSQAEIVYDTANNYDTVCADTKVLAALDAASQAGAGNTTSDVCNDATDAWAASTQLKSTNVVSSTSNTDYWCVDSTGASKIEDSALASATVCS